MFLADFHHVSLPSVCQFAPDHLLNTRYTPLTHLNSLVLAKYFIYCRPLVSILPVPSSILIRLLSSYAHLPTSPVLYTSTHPTSANHLTSIHIHTDERYIPYCHTLQLSPP